MAPGGSLPQPQAAAEAARGGQCELRSRARMEVERDGGQMPSGTDLRRERVGHGDMREHEHGG